MAPEEAVCGLCMLQTLWALLAPYIFLGTVSRTERKQAQSPQHQLSNGVLEALTKQQQEASFFFLVLLSHTLSFCVTYSLSVCQPG